MGVIRNRNRSSSCSYDERPNSEDILENIPANNGTGDETNHLNAVNNELSLALAEELVELDIRRQERNRVRRSAQKKGSTRPEPTFRGLGCRGKSHRKHRRYENSNLLAQSLAAACLGLSAEELLEDINIYDFVPQSMSAFATILLEKDSMTAWNNFITSTEEEQHVLLTAEVDSDSDWDEATTPKMRGKQRRSQNNRKWATSSGEDYVLDNEETSPSCHPAFCPKASFARLDAEMKSLLRRKHFPMGILAALEEDVSKFFEVAAPDAVYQSCLGSSFQRFALHATCQWMDLACKSYDKAGNRWSRVTNHNGSFSKPLMNLATYLENGRNFK